MLGHRRLQPLEPRELAVGLLSDLLGQLDLIQALAQLVYLGLGLVGLPQLLLDGLQLLAQIELALAFLKLRLNLRLDARADRHDLELARQDLRQAPQPLTDVELLEQRLLLLGAQAKRTRDQARERAGVIDVGHHHLELLGQVGDLLDDVRERLLDVSHQRHELRRLADDVRAVGDLRHQVGLGLDVAHEPHPLAALDQHPQGAVGHADHARHRRPALPTE